MEFDELLVGGQINQHVTSADETELDQTIFDSYSHIFQSSSVIFSQLFGSFLSVCH